MKFYEVVSGRPYTEAYHRAVLVAFSREAAEEALSSMMQEIEDYERENWLWGPGINEYETDDPQAPLEVTTWDGYGIVPADAYGDIPEFFAHLYDEDGHPKGGYR